MERPESVKKEGVTTQGYRVTPDGKPVRDIHFCLEEYELEVDPFYPRALPIVPPEPVPVSRVPYFTSHELGKITIWPLNNTHKQ